MGTLRTYRMPICFSFFFFFTEFNACRPSYANTLKLVIEMVSGTHCVSFFFHILCALFIDCAFSLLKTLPVVIIITINYYSGVLKASL